MLKQLIIPALFLLGSCSTEKPTPYQKEHKKEGYRDQEAEDLKISSFRANSYTKGEDAVLYAEFHAIEVCRAEHKHANMMDVGDRSERKDVVRTSGSGWAPTYGYGFGMYPYYSRYSSVGLGVGYTSMNTDSWSETLIFPVFDVYYNCSEKIFRPQILFKEISAENMKLLVKDLKGALQIEKIMDTSPNQKSLEPGDIILKANNQRVEKIYHLIRHFDGKHSEVLVEIMREGVRKKITMKANEVSAEVEVKEKEIIDKVCKLKKDDAQKELKTSSLCR